MADFSRQARHGTRRGGYACTKCSHPEKKNHICPFSKRMSSVVTTMNVETQTPTTPEEGEVEYSIIQGWRFKPIDYSIQGTEASYRDMCFDESQAKSKDTCDCVYCVSRALCSERTRGFRVSDYKPT